MSDREIMNAKRAGQIVERDLTADDEYVWTNDIDELKVKYPAIHKEYEKIAGQQFHLFARKMLDYGKSNISVGTNLDTEEEVHVSLTGLWFRMNDKINRLKQLVLLNKDARVKNESVTDTFQDLSIYGIIAQIVSNGNWK
jgi:hypothetical protein